MAAEVYANTRSISGKASDGKSICSFPDVCFTPPQTPATPPGVPLPYPNTTLSSDTNDGSSTVLAGGEQVMLKDKSFFKKSSGDEAGCAPQKGMLNSTNTGKAYFHAWSMDVKIENENVVRHLDITTHNHASSNANASIPWPEVERMAIPKIRKKPCNAGCPKKPDKERAKELRRGSPSDANRTAVNKGKKPATCPTCKQSVDSLAADHIIPLKRIMSMPGFACLSDDDQEKLSNADWNFIGICTSCNSSKGAKLWHKWSGVKSRNISFNPAIVKKARAVSVDIFVKYFATIQAMDCG